MSDKEKREHFSIRKLSVGAASVLIGISLFGGVTASKGQTVKADADPDNDHKASTNDVVENNPAVSGQTNSSKAEHIVVDAGNGSAETEKGNESQELTVPETKAEHTDVGNAGTQGRKDGSKANPAALFSQELAKATPNADQQEVTKHLTVHYTAADQYNNPIQGMDITAKMDIRGHIKDNKFVPTEYRAVKRDLGNNSLGVVDYKNPNNVDPAAVDPVSNGELSDWIPVDKIKDLTFQNSQGTWVDPLSYGTAWVPDHDFLGYRYSTNPSNVKTKLDGPGWGVTHPMQYMLDNNLSNAHIIFIWSYPKFAEGQSVVQSKYYKGITNVSDLQDNNNTGIKSGLRVIAHNYFTGKDELSNYSRKGTDGETPRVIVNGCLPGFILEDTLINTTDKDQTITDAISWNKLAANVGVNLVSDNNNIVITDEQGNVISKDVVAHGDNGENAVFLNGINIKKGQTLKVRIPVHNSTDKIQSFDPYGRWTSFNSSIGKTANDPNLIQGNSTQIKVAIEQPVNYSNLKGIEAGINPHLSNGLNWNTLKAPDYVQKLVKDLTPAQLKEIIGTNDFGEYDADDNWGSTSTFTNGTLGVRLDAPYHLADGTTTTLQKEMNKVGYVTDMTHASQINTPEHPDQTYLYFSDNPNDKFLTSGSSSYYPDAVKAGEDITVPTGNPVPGSTGNVSNPQLNIGVHPIIITKDITSEVGKQWDGTKNLVAVKRLNSSSNQWFFPADDTNWNKNWDTKKLGPTPLPAQEYKPDLNGLNIFSENDPLFKLNDITKNDCFKINSSNLPMKADGTLTTPGVYTVTYSMPISVPKMSDWGKVIPGEYYTVLVQRQAKITVLGERNNPFIEHVDFVDDNGNPLSVNGKTFQEVTQPIHIKTSKNPDGTITTVRQPENIEYFKEFTVPKIPGYTYRGYKTPNGLLQSANDYIIPPTKLADITYEAVYTPNKQTTNIKFVDDNEKGTQVGASIPVSGFTNEQVTINPTIPENYELANKNELPSTYKFKAENSDIVIHLVHKTASVEETKDITRTITAKEPTGDVDLSQKITISRKGTKDLVTGKTSNWSDWSKGSFAAKDAPTVPGYVASPAKVEAVSNVGEDYVDPKIVITYSPINNGSDDTPAQPTEAPKPTAPTQATQASEAKKPAKPDKPAQPAKPSKTHKKTSHKKAKKSHYNENAGVNAQSLNGRRRHYNENARVNAQSGDANGNSSSNSNANTKGQKILPRTSERNYDVSILGFAIASLGAMFGLAGDRKRKNSK